MFILRTKNWSRHKYERSKIRSLHAHNPRSCEAKKWAAKNLVKSRSISQTDLKHFMFVEMGSSRDWETSVSSVLKTALLFAPFHVKTGTVWKLYDFKWTKTYIICDHYYNFCKKIKSSLPLLIEPMLANRRVKKNPNSIEPCNCINCAFIKFDVCILGRINAPRKNNVCALSCNNTFSSSNFRPFLKEESHQAIDKNNSI